MFLLVASMHIMHLILIISRNLSTRIANISGILDYFLNKEATLILSMK